MGQSIRHLLSLFSNTAMFLKRIRKHLVLRHKRRLQSVREHFSAYPQIAFVFQTFNKAGNLDRVLAPFLRARVANITLFADGCIDRSAAKAHAVLPGPGHLVLLANDTHEIRNYRTALHAAQGQGCSFAVLLQDDDIYSESIFGWLEVALARMTADPSIAIVGGNGGANFIPGRVARADEGLSTVRFETWSEGGESRFRLGAYQEMTLSRATPTFDASSSEFVATVNRAPQLVSIPWALRLGFFPVELEPFQYDDDYNCLLAWTRGAKVLHLPTACKTGDVGVGGMRLYNAVGVNSRPTHFRRNWNLVLDRFSAAINSGQINELIIQASRPDLR
jgi:hypothetical protein